MELIARPALRTKAQPRKKTGHATQNKTALTASASYKQTNPGARRLIADVRGTNKKPELYEATAELRSTPPVAFSTAATMRPAMVHVRSIVASRIGAAGYKLMRSLA